MASHPRVTQVVIVGASAGGVHALSRLVASLPATFPAPLVLAPHLSSTHPSHLTEILARHSPLPVRTVTHDVPLEPGIIFVAPPNQQVMIHNTRLHLEPVDVLRPKPTINRLFSSAAEAFGERLIAVILSGAGSDGADGARLVKAAGGTVLIQDPATAEYPGMPQALAPTTVDVVTTLERMGPLLAELVTDLPLLSPASDPQALTALLEDLQQSSGLDFSRYKRPLLLQRLHRRMLAAGMGSVEAYAQYLHTHPEEYHHIATSFLIKVTEFFRDPAQFDLLRERLLPELMSASQQRGAPLRLWSAGCATGEEAYSVAILLAEMLGESLEQANVRIFATDVDPAAVAFARRGIYPPSAVATLPADLRARSFTEVQGQFHISQRLRTLIVFGQHDLGQSAPFGALDLVLCRNVLIYFTPELQTHALQLFAYGLRPGGALVLGHAESARTLPDYFELQDTSQQLYRRSSHPMLPPLAPVTRMPGLLMPVAQERPLELLVRPPTARKPAPQHLSEVLLLPLPVGIIEVDRSYDIQGLNQTARQFCTIQGPVLGQDLLHLMEEVPARPLRTLIDQAFRTETTPQGIEVTMSGSIGKPRRLQITATPHSSTDEETPRETVVLLIFDITLLDEQRQALEQQVLARQTELKRSQQEAATQTRQTEQRNMEAAARQQRMVESHQQMRQATDELTVLNEALQRSNEEVLQRLEEAQAAEEAAQTAYTDMQSVKEQIDILNAALLAANEELRTTNADLVARGQELEAVSRTRERERTHLSTLLLSLGEAVVVLDTAGHPLLENAAYAQLVTQPDASFVPCDEAGQPLAAADLPQARAARGEAFRMGFTLLGTGRPRRFEARGQPIRDQARVELGGVLLIKEVSEPPELRSLSSGKGRPTEGRAPDEAEGRPVS